MELTNTIHRKSGFFTAEKTLVKAGEWRFVGLVTILVLVVTSIPYLYGYLSVPPDQQFMGLVFNVSDHTQYFSWYRDFQSNTLISNRMTSEPSAPLFFNLLWWVLARIGLYTGLSYIQVFFIFRLIAAIIFLLILYYFCSLIFSQTWERRIAFLMTTFASGLGWILVVMKYTITNGVLLFPLDIYKAGTNTFLSLMAFPHFIMANALILATFALILIGYDRLQLRYAIGAGIVATILAWQHVYDLITIYGVLGVFFGLEALRRRAIPWYLVKTGLILIFFSIWTPIYALYLTNYDPNWRRVLDQFDNAGVFTSNPFHMIILVGLPLLLAVFTFDGITPLKDRSRPDLFVKIWFLTSFFLAYLPVGYQVHLTNLWQVPVSFLATVGICRRIAPYLGEVLDKWLNPVWSPEQAQRLIVVGFVMVSSLTTIYLFSWRLLDLGRHQHPYSYTKGEIAALHWLEEHAHTNDVILSSKLVGQYVPVFTNANAFLAHFAQTIDFHKKRAIVTEFFTQDTPEARRKQILQEYGVDFVFYGPVEQSLGDYHPEASELLAPAFVFSNVQIYIVTLPDADSE